MVIAIALTSQERYSNLNGGYFNLSIPSFDGIGVGSIVWQDVKQFEIHTCSEREYWQVF